MVRKIGRDWSNQHLYFQLRQKLEIEKAFRDTWVKWLTRSIQRVEEPLSKHMTHAETLTFQRKLTCYSYNQFGMSKQNFVSLRWNDYMLGNAGTPGTGDWVNTANAHNLTWNSLLRKGHIMVHRCHVRGGGTCPHMQKGGHEYRWKKSIERDYMHYTRA
eukprot:PhM_4_TR15842/c0_g1_i1/m.23944